MKLFFDSKTGKFIDLTSPTFEELNYHFTEILDDQCQIYSYDKLEEALYQVAPSQVKVGKVPTDVLHPKTLQMIWDVVPSKREFEAGQTQGLLDASISGSREYMSKMRYVSWSFLVGYEYGILLGCYRSKD